jgi:glycosyltransferase involved in cell wall biosynthesis
MKKYTVILFQPYLRRFVLNFGRNLKQFSFKQVAQPPKSGIGYSTLPNYEKEIKRRKVNWKTRLRRLIGIPNIRIRMDREGDLFFTYGCLIITTKPYCTYIENGLALYNYDLGIAKNQFARLIVRFLATRSNCKKLIFLSEASKKSFFATVHYPPWARKILEDKSIVVYPIPIEKKKAIPKRTNGTLKLLFPGTFYMKGGMEVIHAYERLRHQHGKVSLTIITAIHMIRHEDVEYMQSLPGLTLLDAKLNEQEMIDIYTTHDIFLLPTYREGFGLVLIEALAYGMPLIISDQFATKEMVIEKYNGFVYPNHPLKDYDSKTYQLLGKYYNPSDFYRDLFLYQKQGKLKPVEDFLVKSVEKFIKNPSLLEKFSNNSLALYDKKFNQKLLSRQIEAIFLACVKHVEPK